MTETEVIQEIFDTFKLEFSQKGFGTFGDDGVVIPAPSAQDQLILSTDSFCDGTHFDSSIEWGSVGWKALVGSLSDIVAMGAQPSFFMLNLILPNSFSNHKELLSGLYKVAQKYNVSLLGGDVARGESLALSITVGGYQTQSQLKKNSGLGPGDKVFTNAPLGYSLLGFEQHKVGIRNSDFVKNFLYPETPVELGLWLSQNIGVTSLRDISDGFLSELRQLNGDISVEVFKPKFEDSFVYECRKLGLEPEEVFLKGGEDYRLLWSVKEDTFETFIKEYSEVFGALPILVGKVREEFNSNNGLRVVYESNQSLTDSIIPFEHFSS